jgi:hypothetical protein
LISLQQFIEQIAEALDEADNNLEIRRGIIDRLSLQATMNIQDGVKIAEVKCLIGEKILSLTSNTTSHTLPGKNWHGEMG